MAAWAKNLIVKQLAKFAKNIDPSQISLKFLKGEGELYNLELNEVVLSDLLELPPWLKLTKVTCDRITAKVKWTSLKTDPIRLFLDNVEVVLEASDSMRQKSSKMPDLGNLQKDPNAKPNAYGFGEKVVDGMYIQINTVSAVFNSFGFKATFSMSRIIIQSTTPTWRIPDNLRLTRVKDEARDQVLTFKEIKWSTLRIDADASYQPGINFQSAPLRLITNNSALKLTIKKSLSTCEVIASRLDVFLDDILLVLTQSQLLRLSSFVNFILKLREKYLPFTLPDLDARLTAAQKQLEEQIGTNQSSNPRNESNGYEINPIFTRFNVHETSYHIRSQRIDFHLCDDSTLDGEKTSTNYKSANQPTGNNSKTGGALQVVFTKLSVDHCPYHVAGSNRTQWAVNESSAVARQQWAEQLMGGFRKLCPNAMINRQRGHPRQQLGAKGQPDRHIAQPHKVLYESYIEICSQNFEIMKVTTADSSRVDPFLMSTKQALYLPEEMNAFHIDYTTYYYKGTQKLLVPAGNVFVHINPIQLTLHPETCIWLNKFTSTMIEGFEWTKALIVKDQGPPEFVDTRIECLLPKIIMPCDTGCSKPHNEERPTGLQIQLSQAIVTNSRVDSLAGCQSKLLTDLQHLRSSELYINQSKFPNKPTDMNPLPSSAWVTDYSQQYLQFKMLQLNRSGSSSSPSESRCMTTSYEIWAIFSQQLWIDFIGIKCAAGRPVSFLDAIPIQLWLSTPITFNTNYVSLPSSSCSTPGHLSRKTSFGSLSSLPNDYTAHTLTPSNQNIAEGNVIPVKNVSTQSKMPVFYCDLPGKDDVKVLNEKIVSPRLEMKSSHSDGDIFGHGKVINSSPLSFNQKMHSNNSSILTDDGIDGIEEAQTTTNSISMLLYIPQKVNIQLDHFQLLFIIRLQEMLTQLFEIMAKDQPQIAEEVLNQPLASFMMHISLNDIEIKLILPECIGATDDQQLSMADRIELIKKQTNDEKAKAVSSMRSLSPLSDTTPSSKSTNAIISVENEITADHFGSLQLQIENNDIVNAQSLMDVDLSHPKAEKLLELLSFNTSSLATKGKLEYGSSSSTDEMTALVDTTDNEDRPTNCSPPLSPIPDITSNRTPSPEGKQISVVQIRLGNVGCGLQTCGDDVAVKLKADTLMLFEKGNRMYNVAVDDKIYKKDENGMRMKETDPIPPNHGPESMLRLRLDLGPSAKHHDPRAAELGFIDIKIQSLQANLLLSTTDNLAEFAEDEYINFIAPFKVELENCNIKLIDDKPRRYITAVKLPPLPIAIENLFVFRDSESNMKISLTDKNSFDNIQSQDQTPVITPIVEDVSVISGNVDAVRYTKMKELESENERLLDDLKLSNSRVINLEQEREALIKVVDKLQQEMMLSNRENDSIHAKYNALKKMLANGR